MDAAFGADRPNDKGYMDVSAEVLEMYSTPGQGHAVTSKDRFHIDRSRLTLSDALGAGAFGEVRKAVLAVSSTLVVN